MSYDVDDINKIVYIILVEDVYIILVEDVIKGVQRLKLGKSDGEEGLNSDHIIHGPRILYVLLTLVFNSTLGHEYCPASILAGTMAPIPKDKTDLAYTSDNFRIVAKLFDVIMPSKE